MPWAGGVGAHAASSCPRAVPRPCAVPPPRAPCPWCLPRSPVLCPWCPCARGVPVPRCALVSSPPSCPRAVPPPPLSLHLCVHRVSVSPPPPCHARGVPVPCPCAVPRPRATLQPCVLAPSDTPVPRCVLVPIATWDPCATPQPCATLPPCPSCPHATLQPCAHRVLVAAVSCAVPHPCAPHAVVPPQGAPVPVTSLCRATSLCHAAASCLLHHPPSSCPVACPRVHRILVSTASSCPWRAGQDGSRGATATSVPRRIPPAAPTGLGAVPLPGDSFVAAHAGSCRRHCRRAGGGRGPPLTPQGWGAGGGAGGVRAPPHPAPPCRGLGEQPGMDPRPLRPRDPPGGYRVLVALPRVLVAPQPC